MSTVDVTVVKTFFQWYEQLQPSDKQLLCDFLRQWLQPNSGRPTTPALRFGGRTSGPASASTHSAIPITCPNCGTKVPVS